MYKEKTNFKQIVEALLIIFWVSCALSVFYVSIVFLFGPEDSYEFYKLGNLGGRYYVDMNPFIFLFLKHKLFFVIGVIFVVAFPIFKKDLFKSLRNNK